MKEKCFSKSYSEFENNTNGPKMSCLIHIISKKGIFTQQCDYNLAYALLVLNSLAPRQNSPPEGSLQSKNNMTFHYIIRSGVCYLVLCETNFDKKSAFGYLEDLHSEFFVQYGNKVDSVTRPYAFIEFDSYIQKSKRSYSNASSARNQNLTKVNTELRDVQTIMMGNIDDVLKRGVALDQLQNNTNNLSAFAKNYHEKSKKLNQTSLYVKIAAGGGLACFLFFLMRFFIF